MPSYTYPSRRVSRAVAPAAEPVSLSEAKSFLRIDGTADDALIADFITAARLMAEELTGRSFITQSWKLEYDDAAPHKITLPHGPIQSVTSVNVIAENDAETTLSTDHYYLNARQQLVFNEAPCGHRIEIIYVAGYGDAPGDVPTDMAQAMLLHVAHLYEHRDSLNPPLAANLIYRAHREVRL